jgi:hypothetical protein
MFIGFLKFGWLLNGFVIPIGIGVVEDASSFAGDRGINGATST